MSHVKRVLIKLDEAMLVEYDTASGMVYISPKGDEAVEELLLPNLAL